jgi:hypothetical protein
LKAPPTGAISPGGELRNPVRAKEECEPKFFFKIGYGSTDGWLRDVESPRRLAISLPLHDRGEVPNMS